MTKFVMGVGVESAEREIHKIREAWERMRKKAKVVKVITTGIR